MKILVRNMLDNKKNNWEKSKKESEQGPKKVGEIRKEFEEKQKMENEIAQKEYEEEYYDDGYNQSK